MKAPKLNPLKMRETFMDDVEFPALLSDKIFIWMVLI